MMSLFSIALTLFLVMDALGNVPLYLSLLQHIPAQQQKRVARRELLFALIIMYGFYFAGSQMLNLLAIRPSTVDVGGSLILFLVANRLIFSKETAVKEEWQPTTHFIVPIATPVVAGPSLFAILMIHYFHHITLPTMLGAIFLAWGVSALIYLFAVPIYRLLQDKGLSACQRLMGLLVAMIAAQRFIVGIQTLIGH